MNAHQQRHMAQALEQLRAYLTDAEYEAALYADEETLLGCVAYDAVVRAVRDFERLSAMHDNARTAEDRQAGPVRCEHCGAARIRRRPNGQAKT